MFWVVFVEPCSAAFPGDTDDEGLGSCEAGVFAWVGHSSWGSLGLDVYARGTMRDQKVKLKFREASHAS